MSVYSFRSMRRNAGFAAFAILIAGLGVGASATVFSVVNTLLLRPLPFEKPSELVWIANRDLPDFVTPPVRNVRSITRCVDPLGLVGPLRARLAWSDCARC